MKLTVHAGFYVSTSVMNLPVQFWFVYDGIFFKWKGGGYKMQITCSFHFIDTKKPIDKLCDKSHLAVLYKQTH